jgi:plasmid stabilization system protein ParE
VRVRYTERAAQDLQDLLEFLESRNPAAVAKALTAIRTAVRVLGKHPMTGRAQDLRGVRKAVVMPQGYAVYYGIDEAASFVSIAAIQVPAQNRTFDEP